MLGCTGQIALKNTIYNIKLELILSIFWTKLDIISKFHYLWESSDCLKFNFWKMIYFTYFTTIGSNVTIWLANLPIRAHSGNAMKEWVIWHWYRGKKLLLSAKILVIIVVKIWPLWWQISLLIRVGTDHPKPPSIC